MRQEITLNLAWIAAGLRFERCWTHREILLYLWGLWLSPQDLFFLKCLWGVQDSGVPEDWKD